MMTRTDDPMPAVIARDWVMDAANVERDEAVKALAVAAADSLRFQDKNRDSWSMTPVGIMEAMAKNRLGFATEEVERMRSAERDRPDYQSARWLAWCDRAERAVELLRELTAERVKVPRPRGG